MGKILGNQFLLASIYVAKHEDAELFAKLMATCCNINSLVIKAELNEDPPISKTFREIAMLTSNKLKMKEFESSEVEAITYCLQPLIALEIFLRPASELKTFASKLRLVQQLKGYSNTRLYFETIKASLQLNHNAHDTILESLYGAFTFIKLPQVLKVLHQQAEDYDETVNHAPDVMAAVELLLKNATVLDLLDAQSVCNNLEAFLVELAKYRLVNDAQVQTFVAQREPLSTIIQKLDLSAQTKQPIAKLVVRAEHPLTGILKSLNLEYGKLQDANHNMLSQMLKSNSCDLLISVAIMDGKLKQLVSLLIRCNENSKQANIVELDKVAKTGELFDVTFLMLVNLVQNYGSETVMSGPGDTFFEKWVQECMIERNRPKNPNAVVKQCDQMKTDELLMHLRNPESKTTLKWEEICRFIPSVLYHTLQAWNNESISSADAKTIVEGLTKKLCAYSICAGAWLCSYTQVIGQDERQKAMSMLQLIIQTQSEDENVRRKLGLMQQILRKMQYEFHPVGGQKIRALMYKQTIVSRLPMLEHFNEVWKTINDNGWLSIESAQMMEAILSTAGHMWLVDKLVDQVLQCKFIHEMNKTVDIVFAIMHLDIERCTISLLRDTLPEFILNFMRSSELVQPYSTVLARLCVICIISSLDSPNPAKQVTRKRQRSVDEEELGTAMKVIKIEPELGTTETYASEYSQDSPSKSTNLSPALVTCLENMFDVFLFYLQEDTLNPNVYFIFQFFSTLVQLGTEKNLKGVLRTIPQGLIQNLIKVIPEHDLDFGFVTRLYDLEVAQGRQSATSDLCLLRNIKLRSNGILL